MLAKARTSVSCERGCVRCSSKPVPPPRPLLLVPRPMEGKTQTRRDRSPVDVQGAGTQSLSKLIERGIVPIP